MDSQHCSGTDTDMVLRPQLKSSDSTSTVDACSDFAKDKHSMGDTTLLGDHDVLMGRGAVIDRNPGNVRFRELVRQVKPKYLNSTNRIEKHSIALEIYDTILRNNGRFVRQVVTLSSGSNVPFEEDVQTTSMDDFEAHLPCNSRTYSKTLAAVDKKEALSKIKQALRERPDNDGREDMKGSSERTVVHSNQEIVPLSQSKPVVINESESTGYRSLLSDDSNLRLQGAHTAYLDNNTRPLPAATAATHTSSSSLLDPERNNMMELLQMKRRQDEEVRLLLQEQYRQSQEQQVQHVTNPSLEMMRMKPRASQLGLLPTADNSTNEPYRNLEMSLLLRQQQQHQQQLKQRMIFQLEKARLEKEIVDLRRMNQSLARTHHGSMFERGTDPTAFLSAQSPAQMLSHHSSASGFARGIPYPNNEEQQILLASIVNNDFNPAARHGLNNRLLNSNLLSRAPLNEPMVVTNTVAAEPSILHSPRISNDLRRVSMTSAKKQEFVVGETEQQRKQSSNMKESALSGKKRKNENYIDHENNEGKKKSG